jgi:hypothetical protein
MSDTVVNDTCLADPKLPLRWYHNLTSALDIYHIRLHATCDIGGRDALDRNPSMEDTVEAGAK